MTVGSVMEMILSDFVIITGIFENQFLVQFSAFSFLSLYWFVTFGERKEWSYADNELVTFCYVLYNSLVRCS